MGSAVSVEWVRGAPEALFSGELSSAYLLASDGAHPVAGRSEVGLLARVLHSDRPVMVLGSAQSEAVLAPGIVSVRRRSGGGAVWLDPADQVWIDVVIPAGHPWSEPDVGRSFDRVSAIWSDAIAALGVPGAVTPHSGPLRTTSWSPLLCFAGRGPGELFVEDRKLVGFAQRRGRAGALIQCGALLEWRFDPEWFDPRHRPSDTTSADRCGIGLRELVPAVTGEDLSTAFLAELERATRRD